MELKTEERPEDQKQRASLKSVTSPGTIADVSAASILGTPDALKRNSKLFFIEISDESSCSLLLQNGKQRQ